jgi:hypothetical protein
MPDPVTIPDLPDTVQGDVTDSLVVVVYDASATDKTRRATRGVLLHDVLRTAGAESLASLVVTTLTGTNASINTLTVTDGILWNSGEKVQKLIAKTVSAAPSDITASAYEDVAVTISGAATTDLVLLGWAEALPAGLMAQAWPSAADTVTIRFTNTIGTTITGASYAARIMAIAAS